jgi:WhiB family transcriptional regulator, redox-sensing transcriptional regulator
VAIPLHHWMDDDRPWTALAACRDADPELFFSDGNAAGTAVAVRICAGCAVAEECLDWALTARAAFGVWGGTTEQERRRLIRRTA